MKHLAPSTISILEASNAEKIQYVNGEHWISYPLAENTLKKLHWMVDHPVVDRMPCVLLVGDTCNGKSSILKQFVKKYPVEHLQNEGTKLKVVAIQAPNQANEGRLYNEIFESLNIAYSHSGNVDTKFFKLKEILSSMGTRVLIIDELHNVIGSSPLKLRAFNIVVKSLTNQLRISIVAAGTKEAARVLNSDHQLASRFEPIKLEKWKADSHFQKLLLAFESILPFKESSGLAKKEMAMKIFELSEGLLGEASNLLKKAATLAIDNDRDCITIDVLEATGFIPQSKRTSMALSNA